MENNDKGVGLNLNIGGLGNIPSDEEEKSEKFSWHREFEEIGGNKVLSYEITKEINELSCIAKIVTLEKDTFELECSVYGGIKVASSTKEEFVGKVYESLEALLMRASPLYIKTFNDAIREDIEDREDL